MLPADVGAASAAARRYQGTTSTPAPAARHERRASEADPFGDLVDRYADDRDPAAAGGRRTTRPRTSQPPTDPRRAQQPAVDTRVADSHASGVRRQPRQHEVPPSVGARPSAADEGRADLVAPSTLTHADLARTAPKPAGAAGGDDLVTRGAGQGSGGTELPGTPLLSHGLDQASGHIPGGAEAAFEALQVDDSGTTLDAAGQTVSSPGAPLDELELPDGMPPEAASPEVLAALHQARTTNRTGLGATVSATASARSARTPQSAGPATSADARALAMAAVREALAQSASGTSPTAGTAADAVSGGQADTLPVAQTAARTALDHVSGVLDAGAQTTAVAPAGTGLEPTEPQPGDPSMPTTTTAPSASAAASIRPARQVHHVSAATQDAAAGLPLNDDLSFEAAVEATPARKSAHDDAPAPLVRPTARAAQAIAAFHAAAAIGATTTPAAANAAVMGAAVSSTALLDTELPTQLIHAIRVQFDQGSGEARIRLNPGFLGGVTVGVQIDGSSVTASLQAASADVREWMRTNESMLRQALADQGLQLDRLVIVDEDAPATGDEQDTQARDEREQQAPRRQRRTADQGTFEVVF